MIRLVVTAETEREARKKALKLIPALEQLKHYQLILRDEHPMYLFPWEEEIPGLSIIQETAKPTTIKLKRRRKKKQNDSSTYIKFDSARRDTGATSRRRNRTKLR
jgi:hypothetical protein